MQPLELILSTSNDPSLNLAMEEQLLLSDDRDILLFYINRPSVIIGKHQNPWKEVALTFCKEQQIPVLRRLTGGGTVFHDLGNINFSFIRNKSSDFVNFREHILPIQETLRSMGMNVSITERNDLFIEGMKVSGNAEHVNNTARRIIHHGTLLFTGNLPLLRECLHTEDLQIETHAVSSVRSKVTNLSNYSSYEQVEQFYDDLIQQLNNMLSISGTTHLNPAFDQGISALAQKKYRSWEWNIGHTPQFSYRPNKEDFIIVRKGKILELSCSGLEAPEQLIDQLYRRESLALLHNYQKFEHLILAS